MNPNEIDGNNLRSRTLALTDMHPFRVKVIIESSSQGLTEQVGCVMVLTR